MSADPPETGELLGRARQGDDLARAELFARYRELVRQAVALRLDRRLAARVSVSDVVQDTCLEAARRLPDYLRQRPLPFGLWLAWLARERVLAVLQENTRKTGSFLANRRVSLQSPCPSDYHSYRIGMYLMVVYQKEGDAEGQ